MQRSHLQHGFHFLEMLICLAIIGILATMGVINYQEYIRHERRCEAEMMLSKLAIAMEQYHAAHDTYLGVTLTLLDFPSDIANHTYQVQIHAQDQDYVLQATPVNNEDECGSLQLDASGKKYITGVGTVERCW